MKEKIGDMFSDKVAKQFDVICITTSGSIKKDGKAVMGAGNAKAARDIVYGIDEILGKSITKNGNVVQLLEKLFVPFTNKIHTAYIVAFPTKNSWREKSSLDLIERSAKQLVELVNSTIGWNTILLPRPGCSNGKRKWLSEVKPILKKCLDNRFTVIRKR